MSFVRCQGSIFDSGADALVDPVNCVGVHSRGLAREFAKRFPADVEQFTRVAKRGGIDVGRTYDLYRGSDAVPRYIIFFPTKKHWAQPSQLEWIRLGLRDFALSMRLRKTVGLTHTVAIPALGCGLGGLNWEVVRPMIESAFVDCAGTVAYIYGPR